MITQNLTYDWTADEIPMICQKVLNHAMKSILAYQPQRVLDIGCGNGHLCKMLFEVGIEPVGIDPEPAGIKYAKKALPAGTFYTFSSYEEIPELGKFDLISCTEVIEHVYSPRELVKFAKQHLTPNGVFIITTPDYGSYWRNLFISLTNRWDNHHTPLWDGGHIKFWSRKTLNKLLCKEGFSVHKWEGVRSISAPIFNMTMICHASLSRD